MTKKKQTWEERFDAEFPEGTVGHKHGENCEWICSFRRDIKSFIQTLITETRKEALEEAVGVVEGKKVEPIPELMGEDAFECADYNRPLTDAAKAIRELGS